MKTIIIFLILNIFFSRYIFAQYSQTIRGKVFDQDSYMPLVNANILILEVWPLTGVITDENVSFVIEDVPV